MKVILASTSAVKLAAVRAVFGDEVDVIATAAASGVNAQPVGDETTRGAMQRLGNARTIRPDGDVYISIESGIFVEARVWVDRPVVVVERADGARTVVQGHGVTFPADMVEVARAKGFTAVTVGQVMQANGVVRQHDDPHRDLSGISRADYLIDAVRSAVEVQPPAVAKIERLAGYHRFLSNFWPCTVTYDGLTFSNVEAAYHAAKCADPADRAQFVKLSAPAAKERGSVIAMRGDWDAVKRDVMADLLRQKFSDPALRRLLVQTGGCEIVEGNSWNDQFWGVCNGAGENNLGKLLMQVRHECMAGQHARPIKGRKP